MSVTSLERSTRPTPQAPQSVQARPRGEILRAVLQLAALSFAPIFSLWSSNIARFLRTSAMLQIGFGSFLVAGLIAVGLRRLGASLARAVAVASVFLIGLFYWRTLGFSPLESTLDMNGTQHLLAGLIVLFLLVEAYRYGEGQALRVVAFVMALAMVTTAGGHFLMRRTALKRLALPHEAVVTVTPPAGPMPNIYYIVPDGYGRADVLKSLYGFDNDAFLRGLRDHGFYVADRATSNYTLTLGSIPSTLSMQYVLPPGTSVGDSEEYTLHGMLHGDNSVVRSLKHAGYRIVQIESGWSATLCGSLVDECKRQSWAGDTRLELIQDMAVAPLMRKALYTAVAKGRTSRFELLERVARERSQQPRFIFSHVLLPHPPLFLDAKCRPVPDARLAGTALGGGVSPDRLPLRKAAYIDQVQCANTRLENFLNVLDRIDPNSIVIIQADHGPDSRGQLYHSVRTWNQQDLEERFAPLAAYRVPERCRSMLSPDITPVNTFRVVLNCVLGSRLPILPNRHFAFRISEPTLEVHL